MTGLQVLKPANGPLVPAIAKNNPFLAGNLLLDVIVLKFVAHVQTDIVC